MNTIRWTPDQRIEQLSSEIAEDNVEPLVTVSGYGRMTRQQALNTTITYLRQMAESLERGDHIPSHYFDLAKEHYQAAMGQTDRNPL